VRVFRASLTQIPSSMQVATLIDAIGTCSRDTKSGSRDDFFVIVRPILFIVADLSGIGAAGTGSRDTKSGVRDGFSVIVEQNLFIDDQILFNRADPGSSLV